MNRIIKDIEKDFKGHFLEFYTHHLLDQFRELQLMDSTLISHYCDSRTFEIPEYSRYDYEMDRMKLLNSKERVLRSLYQLYKDNE